ncbi:ATP-dependent DNA helicase Q-like 5 [Actinidia eriantha]|uniref:ATP-dependent DNA helicase Q-like 5 n=1 Tax=Actinidia eriantha TaxID=165200 RepID=UPI002590142E|nr:ATP-dependent DNA helicase Q-like 5 [Actinidia eriantha]XP_057496148.1 ATP-dependent DNA helicase Q-like 5 [Actinidia eriantha]XP_057496149.1 ATP-dependent DNA helicase Q-like 5 [Actinidia eriantha]
MDFDSDSDGSHISATPPRELQPPPPPPPPPHSSNKSRIKLWATTSHSCPKPKPKPKPKSKPKPKPKPEPKPKPNPKPSQPEPPPTPLPPPELSNLPFQIRRPSNENHAFSVNNSIGNVTAGGLCLSKFGSFSKNRRSSLNLESIEDDSSVGSESISLGIKGEAIGVGNFTKVVKRHPNLIGGCNFNSPPVKRPKYGNEGNFVRLNINGYGSKFKFKGKGKSYNGSGRRSFRGIKRRFKGGGGIEKKGVCDEDGAGLGRPGVGERARFSVDEGLIEEVVSGVRNEVSDESLLKLLKLTHGYESFRDGQLEVIKMVLSGKSTMLVLPTGAGKSLCYQLPALVLPGIVLVVSPLVALMIDQLKNLPPMIEGGILCSSQTPEEMSETLRLLQEGTIKVLFVSPERFLNAEFISIFSATPLISLLVVDEAHCVSEWSHNFRPSYMRLRASLLRSRLNVRCILAMTATATTKTLNDVMHALEIPPTNLIKSDKLRDNLQLSVTLSTNRMKDLMLLINSPPFSEVQSIIVYCKFQSETDLLSKYLCDSNISAMSYHSGIPTKDRSRIQESFCSNKIRVVVATVAFGMGLDKSDVGAVIHYTLPESLEEYVQEIGRAGRDGRLSYCHLLFDDNTYFKLRSLSYSDGVDEYAVSKLLSQVFTTELDSHGKICSLVKESASRKFDMKEEVILTILTHLELGEVQYLHVLPQINATCAINFHLTPPALLAAKDIVIAAILKKSDTKQGQYVFDVPTVANIIGVSAVDVSNQLQTLNSMGEITYVMKDPAYCYTIVGVPKDFCSLIAHLTKWLSEVESCKVQKIDAMFNAAAFAVQVCKKVNGCSHSQHTPCLQKKILDYFNGDDDGTIPKKMDQSSRFLRADVKVFLQSNSQAKFTPRAIARIMHGIASPAYPSATWSKTHFWGRYTNISFQAVMEAAKAELMNFVKSDVT